MNADFDNLLPVRIFSIHSIIRSSTITYLECLEERYVFDIRFNNKFYVFVENLEMQRRVESARKKKKK